MFPMLQWQNKMSDRHEHESSLKALTSGVFSHTKAESLLEKIVSRIEKHEIEIESLRKTNERSSAQAFNELRESIKKMQSHLDSLTSKVELIEKSIKIPGIDSSTVGEAITANRRSLARTLNLVSKKADSDELKNACLAQSIALTKSINNLKRELVDNQTAQKINEAIAALGNRIDVLSDDVRNKVDNSLFKTISSEANSIRRYVKFIEETENAIEKFDKNSKLIDSKFCRQDEISSSLLNRTAKLEADIQDRLVQNDLHELEKTVEELLKSLETKAEKCSFSEIDQERKDSQHQIDSFGDDVKTLFAAHETLAKHLSRRIDNTYGKDDCNKLISKYLEKDKFFDVMQKLTAEIETKAWKGSLLKLHQIIEKMSKDHAITRKKVDLAAQFIEWYDKRI